MIKLNEEEMRDIQLDLREEIEYFDVSPGEVPEGISHGMEPLSEEILLCLENRRYFDMGDFANEHGYSLEDAMLIEVKFYPEKIEDIETRTYFLETIDLEEYGILVGRCVELTFDNGVKAIFGITRARGEKGRWSVELDGRIERIIPLPNPNKPKHKMLPTSLYGRKLRIKPKKSI